MSRKNIIISIIAVSLLTLVSFSNVVGYNTINNSQKESIRSEFDYDGYTPVQLVFLLINKLRYYEEVEYVKSEEDLMRLIEDDNELDAIYEELVSYSCDCENDNTLFEWSFPIICFIFGFPLILLALLASAAGQSWVGMLVGLFGYMLNCFWY